MFLSIYEKKGRKKLESAISGNQKVVLVFSIRYSADEYVMEFANIESMVNKLKFKANCGEVMINYHGINFLINPIVFIDKIEYSYRRYSSYNNKVMRFWDNDFNFFWEQDYKINTDFNNSSEIGETIEFEIPEIYLDGEDNDEN